MLLFKYKSLNLNIMNEGRLWEPTEKNLAPQEKVLMIKQKIDGIVADFLKHDPKTITAEELFTKISEIDSYQKMAEDSGDENLPAYLTDAIKKVEDHKNLGNLDRMKSMSSFTKVHDPRKPQIGTHN
jgi:hypothetical protein